MKGSIIFFILWSCLTSAGVLAQKSGSFQLTMDYGIDRDIAYLYNRIPPTVQDLILSQVTSKHPRAFTILYQWGKSNWKFRAGAGLLTRSLQKYNLEVGNTGYTNYSQFLGIFGVARSKKINDQVLFSYGLDLSVTYSQFRKTIATNLMSYDFGQPASALLRTTIKFGDENDQYIPMFCPYVQTAIKLSSDTRLLLGLGFYGQFYPSYSFEVNLSGGSIGSIGSSFYRSPVFHMWVPFFRAGIELF
jgi:hypothetical protein